MAWAARWTTALSGRVSILSSTIAWWCFSACFSVASSADAYLDRRRDQLVVLDEPLMPRGEFPLLGDHNVANALAPVASI